MSAYSPALELPLIIIDADTWIDLDTGDEAVIRGRVFAATHKGIVLTFADWTDLYVEAEYGDNVQQYLGKVIDLPVTRTEDGLASSQEQTQRARKVFD